MKDTYRCLVLVLTSSFSPIWGRHIEVSISTFSGIALILSVLLSHSCILYKISPRQFWSSYISVSIIFHVVCPRCYILFFCSLYMYQPYLSLMFATPIRVPRYLLIASVLIFSIIVMSSIHLNICISVLLIKLVQTSLLARPHSHVSALGYKIH